MSSAFDRIRIGTDPIGGLRDLMERTTDGPSSSGSIISAMMQSASEVAAAFNASPPDRQMLTTNP